MNVTTPIRIRKADRLFAQGRLSEAIALCQRRRAWDCVMVLHEHQGDFLSAAEAGKKGKLYEEAAILFEKAGVFEEAAESWMLAHNKERAAAALERAGEHERAAETYESIGMLSQAATALSAANRYKEAGQLCERAGEPAKALEMYEIADEPREMARVLEREGDLAGAARAFRKGGDFARAAELFLDSGNVFESGQCHLEVGNYEEAGDLMVSCEHLLDAAEAYAREKETATKSAELFRKVLRSEVAWRHEAQGPIVCAGMSEDGALIAIGAARKLRMFNGDGELLWRFVPTWGGSPSCVSLSRDGFTALGCDDGHLYLLNREKRILWDYELPGDPLKVSINATGECITCCTQGDFAVCLDKDGNFRWEFPAESIVWDTAVSPDGKLIALGTADGSCIVMSDAGERVGAYVAAKWVHSVSIGDDGMLALGTGMQGVELVDGRTFTPVWSVEDSSPVHNVILTPGKNVLSVGDEEALLRDPNCTVLWRCSCDRRTLGGEIDAGQRKVVFRCVGQMMERVNLYSCKAQAAASFAAAQRTEEAATLYEEIGDHESAARVFAEFGDYANAARNTATAGRILDAAELYRQAEDFAQAGRLFESAGKPAEAATCFERGGETLKAALLFEQGGALDKAAALFEEAGDHGKAGELYRAIENVTGAIGALTQHVRLHPDDWDKRFELGLMLQDDGQHDNAIKEFQQAAVSEALRRKSVMHVAECFLAKDMYDVAIERYKACVGEDEEVSWDNREIFYGLGKAYHLAGNYHEAKRIYEGVLGIDFNYKDVGTRLEDARRLSSVFGSSAPATTPTPGNFERTMVADQAFQQLSSAKKERYVPIRKLGEGGMGTVYLAEDRRLNRQVALKMLPASLRSDEKMRLRIVKEAQSAAQVVHPNVVGVFDVGEERGDSYVSMEYVEGQTLAELLESDGPVGVKECVELLRQISAGLGCAHGKGVSHRDIKPGNIMVTADGVVKIMDFGLALMEGASRVTMPGEICGTPLYMAPEQLRGAKLTPAVDIYAVGCLAYELMTGKPPFTEGNVGIQHLNEAPKPLGEILPDIPAEVGDLVMKCLAKDAGERFQDGTSLNAALREVERAL